MGIKWCNTVGRLQHRGHGKLVAIQPESFRYCKLYKSTASTKQSEESELRTLCECYESSVYNSS